MNNQSKRQWRACPVCGGSEMSWTPEDEGFIVYCTNLMCASNGGNNADAYEPYQSAMRENESLKNRVDELANERDELIEAMEHARKIAGLPV